MSLSVHPRLWGIGRQVRINANPLGGIKVGCEEGGRGVTGRIESWITIINVSVDTSNASTDDVLKFCFPGWTGLQCFILPNTI